jgi:hypothetical protein
VTTQDVAGTVSSDWGTNMETSEYIPRHPDPYAAARVVIEEELKALKTRPDGTAHAENELVGLAVSGGGIRSATFALGVMQALARHDRLTRIDYLSTVSGGGYIGASLTWLLHKAWNGTQLDVGANFPYGTRRSHAGGTREAALLHFLRQHGYYLTPGDGIGPWSLVAVALRGLLLSLLVYGSLLVAAFLVPTALKLFANLGPAQDPRSINAFLALAAALGMLFFLLAVVYGAGTRLASSQKAIWYRLRRGYEKSTGRLLWVTGLLLVLGSLPLVSAPLAEWTAEVSASMTLSGALAGIWAFFKSRRKEKERGKIPLGIIVWAGTALLAYGVLLAAHVAAEHLFSRTLGEDLGRGLLLAVGLATLAAILGWLVNTNYVSVHRYYRDRLMETFLPDVLRVFNRQPVPPYHPDRAPDRAALHDMCDYRRRGARGPYHLINTNVVLVGSRDPKHRGRGGDNFILSPLYCGSGATGWRRSSAFMRGAMTLPTAMAISGAAVNPNTGVGGEGPTRSALLSFLMSLLNIRLGYWVSNPNPERHSGRPFAPRPNYLRPGLPALFSLGMDEEHAFVQLTDGGHFENLGLYELIRRRVKVIVLCDGAADPDFSFADFANALEKIRVDFGAHIDIELSDLIPTEPAIYPEGAKFAKRGHVTGTIKYADNTDGQLIYVKTTLIGPVLRREAVRSVPGARLRPGAPDAPGRGRGEADSVGRANEPAGPTGTQGQAALPEAAVAGPPLPRLSSGQPPGTLVPGGGMITKPSEVSHAPAVPFSHP